MLMRSFYCPIILAVAVLGCGDSASAPEKVTDVFPTQVGSTWVYRLTDRNTGELDTLEVTSIGDREFEGWGSVHVLVYRFRSWSDTVFVAAQEDTVRFLPSVRTGYFSAGFVLPLEVGATWSLWFNDTTRVVEKGEVITEAGEFPGSFRVEVAVPYHFNSFLLATMWVYPGVGIIKETREEYNLGPVMRYDRELIAYHFPSG